MALLQFSIAWLSMASIMGSCPTIPHLQSDTEHAITIAREVLPPDLADVEFETIEASKCASTGSWKNHADVRSETFSFSGYFSNRSQEPDASIRDFVRCSVSRVFRSRSPIYFYKFCVLEVKTLLRFDGIAREIDIAEEVSLDHARQFLTFLSTRVGSEVDGAILSVEVFGNISSVSGLFGDSFQEFYASYGDEYCSSSFGARASGNRVLEFEIFKRDSTVC